MRPTIGCTRSAFGSTPRAKEGKEEAHLETLVVKLQVPIELFVRGQGVGFVLGPSFQHFFRTKVCCRGGDGRITGRGEATARRGGGVKGKIESGGKAGEDEDGDEDEDKDKNSQRQRLPPRLDIHPSNPLLPPHPTSPTSPHPTQPNATHPTQPGLTSQIRIVHLDIPHPSLVQQPQLHLIRLGHILEIFIVVFVDSGGVRAGGGVPEVVPRGAGEGEFDIERLGGVVLLGLGVGVIGGGVGERRGRLQDRFQKEVFRQQRRPARMRDLGGSEADLVGDVFLLDEGVYV